MTDGESIGDFITRLVALTNQMKGNGETVTEVNKVEKVLRSIKDSKLLPSYPAYREGFIWTYT